MKLPNETIKAKTPNTNVVFKAFPSSSESSWSSLTDCFKSASLTTNKAINAKNTIMASPIRTIIFKIM